MWSQQIWRLTTHPCLKTWFGPDLLWSHPAGGRVPQTSRVRVPMVSAPFIIPRKTELQEILTPDDKGPDNVTFAEGSDGKGQEGASGLLGMGAGPQSCLLGKNEPCSSCSIRGLKRSGFCSFWPTLPLILTSPRERPCLTYFRALCIYHLQTLIPLRQLFPCEGVIK